MSARILYRIIAVLLLAFAGGHQFGFRRADPRWNATGVVDGMRNVTFDVQGFTRSYWDFFSGFGFFVTAFLVFAAIHSWQMGAMSTERLSALPVMRWSFAACFAIIAVISWQDFFVTPGVLSTLIALGLVAAAMLGASTR